MQTKSPYGPGMTAEVQPDSVNSLMAKAAKKPGMIFPSGVLGTDQTLVGGSGIKHRSASPPIAGNK